MGQEKVGEKGKRDRMPFRKKRSQQSVQKRWLHGVVMVEEGERSV